MSSAQAAAAAAAASGTTASASSNNAATEAKNKDPIIPFSGALESALVDMPEDAQEAHCKELGAASALPKIIKTGFTALNLIYFFTAGPDEVRSV